MDKTCQQLKGKHGIVFQIYDVLTLLLEMLWGDRVCKNSDDGWKAIRKVNKKAFERVVVFPKQLDQNHNFRCNVMRAWVKVVRGWNGKSRFQRHNDENK